MQRCLPVVLSIAGSDNSAGAGLQADLKTATALGCYGLTAATCVVAEIPGRVEAIQAVNPELLRAQIRLCFEAFPVAAVKTGMLFSTALARVTAEELERNRSEGGRWKLVVDPVMIASSGDPLLRPGAIRIYRRRLFPLAAVITPNLDELGFLTGGAIAGLAAMERAAQDLAARHSCAVLAKGGHLLGRRAVDLLADQKQTRQFSAPFLRGAETHGTGCTYATAIACGLASGLSLDLAVKQAKQYITMALQQRLRWQHTSALRHLPAN